MNRLFFLPLAFATLTLSAALSVAQAADLQVAVRDAGEKGTLYFALFDQEEFLRKPIAIAKSRPEMPSAVFPNLAPGRYALSVYQDLNGNSELDRNLVGAPTEPFGFSNDAMGMMGPPKFDAAALRIGTENQRITIKLR